MFLGGILLCFANVNDLHTQWGEFITRANPNNNSNNSMLFLIPIRSFRLVHSPKQQ